MNADIGGHPNELALHPPQHLDRTDIRFGIDR
jgi:hypothetical protein